MPKLQAALLSALLATLLPACSRNGHSPEPANAAPKPAAATSHLPSDAALKQFQSEGREPTLRRLSVTDYWLHYKLMQATGLETALGGEAQTIAALQAVANAYERKLHDLEAAPPKLLPAAFTGEGMTSGLLGMGMGGFAGLLAGGTLSGAASSMSDAQLAEMVKAGPMKFDGKSGSAEFQFDANGGLTQTLAFEVNEAGVNGKVSVKTRMDACPDPQGRVSVDVDVDSRMRATGKPGTSGYVQTSFKYERYLDDDAQLINDGTGGASNLHIRMGGHESAGSQHLDITLGHQRDGTLIFENHMESGFSIFRPDEVARTQKLLRSAEFMQTLIAEFMLRGTGSSNGSPWESGRCINLKVTSDPGQRNRIKPNTAFDLEAMPRAKADGAVVGGSVRATLTGSARLLPGSGKVPADAAYQYAGPEQKNQTASIAFEARSKRGVGKATLDFDTRERAWRIKGGQNDFFANVVVCSVTRPFDIKSTAGLVMHMSGGESGGSWTQSGKAAGVGWSGGGQYTLKLDEDGSGWLEAKGVSDISTPMGHFKGAVAPAFSLTPVDAPCE